MSRCLLASRNLGSVSYTLTMAEDSATRLKASIYLSVAKAVEEKTAELKVAASPSFVASLVELVFNQLVSVGEDLELFADHAGRSVVNSSDVYMVTRRNEILTAALKEYEKTLPK
ncbi:hypothetical protein EJF18_50133 [Clavispora lusitaniae]|uniref:Uncharacterized protein n=1 Tax=Clavispora lusitaniae TaxID=36911 RepID=A0ACD0WNQ5_CLALS|nr:hypothetical protein EJF14_50133 [Clavispora lusitaniae]QFZ34578.1 hypothetical protein EJF16_50133 [Clavispora lusitaniae]QFZ40263.1 hypothetical protein EJF15_50133 [Clavispora lusitaniae]QFZ45943.1 hypothetical protein EJF18_50133 [Clavispora lusitaniae]QFZ51605.1 hypothetical protein EJF17_50133 [Clavispora lusitaniae]